METIYGRDPFTESVIEVEIDDDIIVNVRPSNRACTSWLAPGFVDLQVNGYSGFDLNALGATGHAISTFVHSLIRAGTTTFLPTIVTASLDKTEELLRAIQSARHEDPLVRHTMPYIHLEGPHISPRDGYRGAHDKRFVRAPSIAEFDQLQVACDNHIALVTMSPHWDGSIGYIRSLRDRGVFVAIGHTHASTREIQMAVEAGACLSTHLGNGLAPMLDRHLNPLWPQLADERLVATFIADGVHTPKEVLISMIRMKGIGGAVLVSDSVALAGCRPGSYDGGIGGEVLVSEDGSVRMIDSGLLAGSGTTLGEAVGFVAGNLFFSLGDAVRMATENPGRFVPGRGRIATGNSADLIRFDWKTGDSQIRLLDVYVAGQKYMLAD